MEDKTLPKSCPNCGSTKIARIQYGLPHLDDELEQGFESGNIVLGGCVIFGQTPEWYCISCEYEWGSYQEE